MDIKRAGLVAVLAISLVALVGCQQVAEKATQAAIEKTTGVSVDKDGDSVTIKDKDGNEITATEGGKVPEDFPADVPVYQGDVTTSVKAEKAYTLAVNTPDAYADVFDWYKTELDKEGWKVISEMKVSDGGAIIAEKGANSLQVTVGPGNSDKGGTLVTIFWSVK